MTVQKINNGVLYGVTGDTKPTTYADNTLFFEQDTGSIYKSASGSWSIIAGPTKTETLTNKTMNSRDNSLPFLAQSYMCRNLKRCGVSWPVNGGTQHIGVTNSVVTTGTYSIIAYNTTDGQIGANYLTGGSDGSFGGFQCPVTTQWSDNPRFKVSVKMDSTATGRFYAGWSTLTTFPKTDTPFGASDKGIAFGYRTTDTNFTIFHHDGSGSAIADAMSTPVAKTNATTKFTVEIICSTSSAQVIYNDTNSTTISADLPTTTDQLAFFVGGIASSATARNFKFYGLDGENI